MRRLALTLLAAAALGLSACGGGSSDDEAEIREMIEVSARNEDPAGCRRYLTPKMLEQTYKVGGEVAVGLCEQTVLEDWPLPTSVTVTGVEIEGDGATAHVAYEGGGSYAGQVPILSLVREDGAWREDEVLGFDELDGDLLALELGREMLRKARSGAEARALGCMVEQLDRLDNEQLEAVMLDPSPQPLIELARPCEPRSDAI